MKPIHLPLIEAARVKFYEWRRTHNAEIRVSTGPYASALGKHPGMVARIALVLEHLWWAASDRDEAPKVVSELALLHAIEFIEDYQKPMVRRVLGEAARPKEERHAILLAREILRTRPASVNARDIRRTWRLPGLSDKEDIEKALQELVEARWLTKPEPSGGAGRRPKTYNVNANVYEATS